MDSGGNNNEQEQSVTGAALSDDGAPKQQQQEEDETAALTDMSTTSLSSQEGSTGGGVAQVPVVSTDAKLPFRSFFATRQTIADLEGQAKKETNGCHNCGCGGVVTKPGAVAVDGLTQESLSVSEDLNDSSSTVSHEVAESRSDTVVSGVNNEETPDHVVLNIRDEDEDDGTNCHSTPASSSASVEEEIPMIHATLAEEPPIQAELVQATLVVPPPVAYHVQFDEEAPQDPTSPTEGSRQPPVTLPIEDTADLQKKLFSRRNVTWVIRCHVFLLVLGLILGILIPKLQEENFEQELLEDIVEDDYHFPFPHASPVMLEAPTVVAPSDWSAPPPTPAPATAPTPQPSVLSVYDCYKSLLDVAIAQVEDPSEDGLYHLCPNVRFKLGGYNDDYTSIEEGDYPLTALRDSIEIRCAFDGRKENHCVIDGGFLQVALNPPSLPNKTLTDQAADAVDNVTFRGITFTGQLNTTNNDSYPSGTSVYMNQPGRNVTFIDCAWENMVAPNGVAQIGADNNNGRNSSLASGEEPSMGVTFENCTFSNIEYGGGGAPLMSVFGQEAVLRRCRFEGLSLPTSLSSCVLGGNTMEFCQGLLYCFDHSRCELSDICVDGLEFAGPGAIATTSHETDLTVSGSMIAEELVVPPGLSFLNCSSGLAMFADEEFLIPECWDDAVDVFFSNETSSSNFCGF
ncbi:expressed unknown protein [Seminavis robusta]|uniref:Right handed beta helix domain-containing protein n=1 Tax=Seminavis robusta TaxID=568900 RepID=A0A9N8E0H2_9STRA|nr:expressed unknown protein [Seminavis robusta]|eukprot:Sro497_g154750.1 n/a (684) ;mRNA; f:21703-23754